MFFDFVQHTPKIQYYDLCMNKKYSEKEFPNHSMLFSVLLFSKTMTIQIFHFFHEEMKEKSVDYLSSFKKQEVELTFQSTCSCFRGEMCMRKFT